MISGQETVNVQEQSLITMITKCSCRSQNRNWISLVFPLKQVFTCLYGLKTVSTFKPFIQ